jgi:hypothetical protein
MTGLEVISSFVHTPPLSVVRVTVSRANSTVPISVTSEQHSDFMVAGCTGCLLRHVCVGHNVDLVATWSKCQEVEEVDETYHAVQQIGEDLHQGAKLVKRDTDIDKERERMREYFG